MTARRVVVAWVHAASPVFDHRVRPMYIDEHDDCLFMAAYLVAVAGKMQRRPAGSIACQTQRNREGRGGGGGGEESQIRRI